MRNELWYLLAGSSGGVMRARILLELKKRPANAHQITKKLKIDYKTARYHLDLLAKSGVLDIINKEKYGSLYIHSAQLEANWSQFDSIWKTIGKDLGRSL